MVELKSFAKINLGLEIVGKREDGYHDLRTIFQAIDFYDSIEIVENRSKKINLSGSDPSIEWDEKNTILKALRKLYKLYDLEQGFDIHVTKRIPPGSGLGGGSSNAAVVMLYLVEYFHLPVSFEELVGIAAGVGADVPFFLIGGTVLAEGIGEKMTVLEDIEEKRLDLVIPPFLVSTKLVFSQFLLTRGLRNSTINTFISSKKINALENNLETITFKLFPGVGLIKKRMSELPGYECVLMSGSGSSVFGVYENSTQSTSETGKSRETILENEFPGSRVILTKTIGRENYKGCIGAWPSGKASVFGADTRRFESSRPSY